MKKIKMIDGSSTNTSEASTVPEVKPPNPVQTTAGGSGKPDKDIRIVHPPKPLLRRSVGENRLETPNQKDTELKTAPTKRKSTTHLFQK
jgi:hypothetical protein